MGEKIPTNKIFIFGGRKIYSKYSKVNVVDMIVNTVAFKNISYSYRIRKK
jgi:hypothetical protein